jgi:RNA polymerase sigma-70 factor (ECF subfamily)
MDRLKGDPERRLVEKCLSGDRQAWEEFFECYMRCVSAVVSRPQWGFLAHEREDVAQEVLRRLILSLKDFEFRSKLSTFVCAVAVNTCAGEVRKRASAKRRGDVQCVGLDVVGGAPTELGLETPTDEAKNQERLLLDHEEAERLRAALAGLDIRCRSLLRMRYYDDMSFKEIAGRLQLRENSLVVQMKRCLVRLLKLMKVEAEDGLMQR